MSFGIYHERSCSIGNTQALKLRQKTDNLVVNVGYDEPSAGDGADARPGAGFDRVDQDKRLIDNDFTGWSDGCAELDPPEPGHGNRIGDYALQHAIPFTGAGLGNGCFRVAARCSLQKPS